MADLDAATLEPGVSGPSDELAQTLDGNADFSQAGRSPFLPVSQQVGRFVVLRLLGQGGTGTVYAAYDEKLDRKIAVKLLANVSSDPKAHRDRVLREAQAMARISHPNVVQVFEVGELGSQVFIAMEFIDGVTLATWQRAAGRSWQEILQLYRAAGQGLWAAHQVGLIHRDFKADNVPPERKRPIPIRSDAGC